MFTYIFDVFFFLSVRPVPSRPNPHIQQETKFRRLHINKNNNNPNWSDDNNVKHVSSLRPINDSNG